ncbi:LCP family protein [Desulfitobacterium hafniense]|uniref:LCP family protein n=1 Tax=Desulfitobacterium hafniense TaxID=49338 RepID=UPI0003647E94|nr:LCP family protein [Desulfitobacterium hafniense]
MRKKSAFKRLGLTLLVMVLLVGGIVLGFSGLSMSKSKPLPGEQSGPMTEEELKNRISVLLIGADQRPEEQSFNTDTIILATIDPKSARVSLLSIPRDTRVSIPGHKDIKINGVAPLTDLDNLVDVVSDLVGIPISGYIQTNFNGFKQIIDTLGGITVDVEKDMYYETGDDEDGYINLKKGLQKLDGSKALQYARFRNDGLGDISRTARQQIVLKAVAGEMLKLGTLPKLPWLIPQLNEAVNTNLQLGDMFKIAKTAVKFKDVEIYTQTLPGSFHDMNGISYWDVDPEQVKEVVSNLLRGITTDKVIGDTIIDLLEPVEPSIENPLPQVPGSPGDPNGTKSPDYHITDPDDEGNPAEGEKPVDDGTENEPGKKPGDEPGNEPGDKPGNEPGEGTGEEPGIPEESSAPEEAGGGEAVNDPSE